MAQGWPGCVYSVDAGGDGQSFYVSTHTHVRALRIRSRDRVGRRRLGLGSSLVLLLGPQTPGEFQAFYFNTVLFIPTAFNHLKCVTPFLFSAPFSNWNTHSARAGTLGCMVACELGSICLLGKKWALVSKNVPAGRKLAESYKCVLSWL